MPAAKNSLQDVFLNAIRKDHASVTVFLVNGVKLQGMVVWFDSFCILLKREQHVQLVYKHAVSTIMPAAPIDLGIPEDGQGAAAEAGEGGGS